MNIREAVAEDFDAIWPIFHTIVAAGETYAYATDTTKIQAQNIWLASPRKIYVCEEGGAILGTYYIKTNQQGCTLDFTVRNGHGNTSLEQDSDTENLLPV